MVSDAEDILAHGRSLLAHLKNDTETPIRLPAWSLAKPSRTEPPSPFSGRDSLSESTEKVSVRSGGWRSPRMRRTPMAKRKAAPPIPKPAIQPGGGGSVQSGTLVRSPLYLEQQKFKDKKRLHKQLSLSLDGRELEEAVEASGLDLSDLSVSELKAYDAVSQLLSRTGHKGSEPGKEAEVESMKWRGVLPVLFISRSDYFEAYGLKRKGDGSYYGHQAEEALEALRSLLTATRRVVYTRTTWSGKGKSRKAQREAVVYTGPLASIMER